MCDALTSIDVPDSVRTIGGYAFAYSHSLAQITLGVNATTIGEFAFRECMALSSINIPDGVTTIDEGAFCDCDALTEVSLPVSVTALGKCVFGTLPVVYYEGTTAQWNAVAKAEILFYADSKINSVVCVDGTLTY